MLDILQDYDLLCFALTARDITEAEPVLRSFWVFLRFRTERSTPASDHHESLHSCSLAPGQRQNNSINFDLAVNIHSVVTASNNFDQTWLFF